MGIYNNDIDLFLFYGILLDRTYMHEYAIMRGYSSIYEFAHLNDLNYRKVGLESISDKYVFGKEIHWDYGSNVTELIVKDNSIILQSNLYANNGDIEIKNDVNSSIEDFVQEKFKNLRIFGKPKYYFITSSGTY